MKRDLKKAFSFILVLALVIGLIPAPTSLAAVPGNLEIVNPGTNPVTTAPAVVTDGQIWVDKSVEYKGEGKFDISLTAIGQDYKLDEPQPQSNVDVVFVLDVSGSMGSKNTANSKLNKMKTAVSSAAVTLLGVPGNRVAIVKYSGMATIAQTFTTSSALLNTALNGLDGNGGTNIQNGFLVAENLISDSAVNKPIIILMSDGRPTYYHNDLTNQTEANRSGNGQASNTGSSHVWQTILQAQHAKDSSKHPEIYTIGFDVGNDSYAIATLMPTETNTAAYRPTVYSGEKRALTNADGRAQYYSSRSRSSDPWGSWELATQQNVGSRYKEYQLSPTAVWSGWTSFGNAAVQPVNFMNITDRGNTEYAPKEEWDYGTYGAKKKTAFFDAKFNGEEYRNIQSSKQAFNHTYYNTQYSSITDESAAGIANAFTAIVNNLVNIKPMAYTVSGTGIGASKVYSDLKIVDVLDTGFKISGSLPAGVTQSGDTITWRLNSDTFQTSTPGATTVIKNTIKFTVEIDEAEIAANGGTYYTNDSANTRAEFSVLNENPYYAVSGPQTVPLTNKGWLTLSTADVETSIQITKEVKGPVSNDPRTFEFNVYYNLVNGEPGPNNPPINATTVSITVTGETSESTVVPLTIPASEFNANGRLMIYVKEMSTTDEDYWVYDTWDTLTIDKNAQTPANITFTNTYDPKGTLTVTKKWSGVIGSAVEFVLLKEITSGSGVAWVPAEEGTRSLAGPEWSASIGNLDLNTKYRVEETNNEGLYDYTIGYNPLSVEFTPQALSQTIEITNTYVPPEGKITINKTWVDNENEAGDRPSEITFSYTGPEEGTITLKASEGWTKTLTTNEFGEYTFTENFIQDYQSSVTTQAVTILKDVVASRSAVLNFENTYVEPTGEVTATKIWADENDGDTSYRPDSITLRLSKLLGINTEENSEEWQAVDSVTLFMADQATHNWIHTFKNLTMGTYRITEDQVNDYTTNISGDVTLTKKTSSGSITSRKAEITVTNSFDHPTGKITVNKIWTDDEITSEERPDEITIALLKDGVEIESKVLSGGSYPETTWTHTFDGLALDGGMYTAEELTVDYYDSTVTYGGIGASTGGIVLDKDHRSGIVTVNNTYAMGTITVEKQWVHTGNNDTLPTSVDVTLMVNGPQTIETTIVTSEEVDGVTVTQEAVTTEEVVTTRAIGTKTITGSNAVVFYNLEMGEDFEYFVVEENAPLFYEATYSASEDHPLIITGDPAYGKITVTNTYVEPTGELTVTKDWNHGNNPNRPNSVTVNLYANNNQTPVDTVTLNEQNGWTDTFKELTLGTIYTVEEEIVAKYSTAYYTDLSKNTAFVSYTPAKSNLEEEVVVSNTYNTERGDLKVTKKWVGTTGGPITVYLTCYDGNTQIDFSRTATLSSGNDWTYTFEGLELYGATGLYQYHIAESGAGVLYSQNSYDTVKNVDTEAVTEVVIQNTYNPYQGELKITKEWRGTGGELIAAPEVTIEAILVADDDDNLEDNPSYLLNAANNWTVTVGGLDVDKTYKVIEITDLEGYGATYSSDSIRFSAEALKETLTITNTRTPDEPEIGIEKEVFNSGTILDDGSATLHYALHIYNRGNRTLTNIFIVDGMVPTGTAVGAKISYSAGEQTDDGIRIEIPGGLKPEDSTVVYYSVTVDKAGLYDNKATVYGYYGETERTATANEEALVKPPGLNIEKDVIGASSKSGNGGTFTYQLTITYDGDIPLTDVNVKDVMTPPDSSATVKYNYSGSDFDPATKTFTIGDLHGIVEGGEGDKIIITYTVTVTGRGTYNNTAKVTGKYRTVEFINDEEILIEGDLSDSDDAAVSVTKPSDPPPNRPDDPEPPVIIPPEETPAGPTPDVVIPDDQVPAGPLPKTGGLDALLLYGLGALLAGGGIALRRREKNK